MRLTALKVRSFDFYSGVLKPGAVLNNVTARELKDLGVISICLLSVQMSTFPLLHADMWLSIGKPLPKEGHNIFAHCKTGGSGVGRLVEQTEIDLMNEPLYWMTWAHNMDTVKSGRDFHASLELHYT